MRQHTLLHIKASAWDTQRMTELLGVAPVHPPGGAIHCAKIFVKHNIFESYFNIPEIEYIDSDTSIFQTLKCPIISSGLCLVLREMDG